MGFLCGDFGPKKEKLWLPQGCGVNCCCMLSFSCRFIVLVAAKMMFVLALVHDQKQCIQNKNDFLMMTVVPPMMILTSGRTQPTLELSGSLRPPAEPLLNGGTSSGAGGELIP